jgi:DNA-binding NtrC family response regulator
MMVSSQDQLTVLIVDDDPIACGLLHNILRAAGFNVEATSHPETGLLELCRQRSHIAWLVTRVRLPGLVDGWLLADEYHRHHAYRPVVLLTAEGEAKDGPAIDAVSVPHGSPMRVLETLKALAETQAARPPLPAASRKAA